MIIHLNENRFYKLFLIESKNSNRAKKQTIELIAQRFGLELDSPYVINLEKEFKNAYFTHGLDNDRYIVFEPNLCKCALEVGYGTRDFTDKDKDILSSCFNAIFTRIDSITDANARSAELKRIKDGLVSFEALQNIVNDFSKTTADAESQDSEPEEQITDLQNGYSVIGPVNYEMAHEYGKHTNPNNKLCFTLTEATWKKYSKGGLNNCYILLRNGWENIKPIHDGSNTYPPYSGFTAYDNYGTSMIFIFVAPSGDLETANGRWNHEARASS